MDRLQLIHAWLEHTLPGRTYTLATASADASFRRYFRITLDDSSTRIVMDAPPTHEDCRPFLQVASLLRVAGVNAPEVHAQDLEQGLLLLSDLGDTTYLAALTPDNASELYADALGALAAIQRIERPAFLPEYDRALLLREMMLLPEWYVARHKGVSLTDAETAEMLAVFESILAINLAEPQVVVHRDYHCRNLMTPVVDTQACSEGRASPGVLDFQDAVFGPITYDLASLFKDAYIHWEEEQTLDWLIRYWEIARQIGLPVRADFNEFHRDYEFMAAQRHIKILGIFARLCHRDGKHGYLKDMPLVMHYLKTACRRYRELRPLLRLLDRLDPEEVQVGYTF